MASRRACGLANDALCAALQVINHLQDCGKDYRELNRVYIPEDMLNAAGVGTESLAQPAAGPALAGVIAQPGVAQWGVAGPVPALRGRHKGCKACAGS